MSRVVSLCALSLLSLNACATFGGDTAQFDPEVLEVQTVVLDHILRDASGYMEEAEIQAVCVVAAVRSSRGVGGWAGERGGRGEWPSELIADRLALQGWPAMPIRDCELEDDRWINTATGDGVALVSAAGMDWDTDDLVFVDAGIAHSLDSSRRYECTVERREEEWAVVECSSQT